MSLIEDNVIPGNQGKRFSVNVKNNKELEVIKNRLMEVEGVKEVALHPDKYPMEFDVITDKLVHVKTIEDKVITLGYHALPKGLFNL